ncbi:MAG: CYTH domain-containing protein [Clostridiales Family XIII bacterium]|nr:CYTH domain-containing protein [Clostridiales Family XIII bacterium]
MEVELKYKLHDKYLLTTIPNDEYLIGIEEMGTRERVFMKAAYFDTENYILSENDIAFRVRMEGARIVASLKWNDSGEDGLYTREEINVPVDDPACFLMPDPMLFKESEVGKHVVALLDGKPLVSIFEMKFLRNRFRVDTGGAICEVSLDDGDIVTDFGERHIAEIEIELFSGSRDDLLKLGAVLSEKYGLAPELESKYARGLKLLGRGRSAGVRTGAKTETASGDAIAVNR